MRHPPCKIWPVIELIQIPLYGILLGLSYVNARVLNRWYNIIAPATLAVTILVRPVASHVAAHRLCDRKATNHSKPSPAMCFCAHFGAAWRHDLAVLRGLTPWCLPAYPPALRSPSCGAVPSLLTTPGTPSLTAEAARCGAPTDTGVYTGLPGNGIPSHYHGRCYL